MRLPSLLSPTRIASLRHPYLSQPLVFARRSLTAPPRQRVMIRSDRTIALTEPEEKLCSLLEEFRLWIKAERPEEAQVECRIAGGWVRDKLLSLPSADIDLALSHHTGHPFALLFSDYLSTHHPQIAESSMGSIAKIESNPEQSKHLETAKQEIMGLDIDYVNLRKEGYTEGSRIPSAMEFGTPLEDALRRDITINSLFYNVHTRKVEDWTEMGLADLSSGLIRTPLPPRETFDDDPLRILRCIRFASRYSFDLHPDISESLKDEKIRQALRERISRERVGIEIEKMCGGRFPLLSFRIISSLSLHASIFFFPPHLSSTLSSRPLPDATALASATVLSHLLPPMAPSTNAPNPEQPENPESSPSPLSLSSLPELHPALLSGLDKTSRKRMFLTAAVAPYKGLTVKEKKKDASATEMLIKDGIKLSGADASFVSRLYQSAEALSLPTLDKFPTRSSLGNLLRQPFIHNPSTDQRWSNSILWSLVMDLIPTFDVETGTFSSQATSIISTYNTLISHLLELDLPSSLEAKPILDGKAILSLLSLRPGPQTRLLIDAVVTYQLDHPSASPDEASAWLKEEWEKGTFGVEEATMAGGGKEGGSKKAKKVKVT